MHLGYAAGKVLAGSDQRTTGGDPPAVLIGKDTRISGYMHASALIALGLLLFVITLSVLAVAKYLLLRVAKREGTRT